MKRIILTVLISFLFFQCKIFKPSSLDPSEDIGSLQALLRLLALADAFNTQSQSVLFMKFTDSNGTPYANGVIEYFVFNEADENGVATSPYGESGNVQTYTATLDTSGRAFLFFSERGIANISLKNVSNTFIGTASFRIYNGITKQLFSIYKQTGNAQYILEDLANYRNRFATSNTFTSLGSANGRQFIYLEVQSNFNGANNFTTTGYIASSADGEYYDQITKIDGVSLGRNTTTETVLKVSLPMFNGSEYVFFLSEETRSYPGLSFSSNKNLYVKFSAFLPPSSVKVVEKTLPNLHRFFESVDNAWYYPALALGSGKYLGTPLLSGVPNPLIIQLDSDTTPDLVGDFSCSVATPDVSLVAYQLISHLGVNYLQCPTSFGSTFLSKSIKIPDLTTNQVTFDAVSPTTFDSPVFPVQDQLVAVLFSSPNYFGTTFPKGSYANASPTIPKNGTQITGFTSSIGGGSSRLRTVKSSNSNHYFLLSNAANFASPTIEIYRSSDNLTSVTQIPSLPSSYSTGITNPEQLQSANGKLNYSFAISAGIGIGSLPVYLNYSTRDDGTWESLPKLIKIK
ncbi:hypothetical protein [Leptospira paudalimensis]|uniref:Lipoprotein n=1 Tax=Leptospira paudalimensis TaxID=2950024 RepID=A0ABT3M4F5_9LEPT|nr:hypothetical protein [Leptospira paudalimensis]MCW7503262.1 hypothetical protein [Leptospira paudalimensis]